MSTAIVVALATQSAIKKEATAQAFSKVFPTGFELKCHATSSDINEQPIGFQETIKGATNRINNMISLMEKESATAQYKVAIENGLIQVAGWIVLESSKTGTRYSATSTGLPFDAQYVNKAREEGFEKMTAGEVMSKALGCDSKDPHKYLCNEVLGRKDMLVQALETCLGQCLRAEGH